MATLKDPGEYDCLNKLQEDEPYFTLMGRDNLAPFLVVAWAELARGNVTKAVGAIKAAHLAVGYAATEDKQDKLTEAYACGAAMSAWKTENPGPYAARETEDDSDGKEDSN